MPMPTLPATPIAAAGTSVTIPTHVAGDLLIIGAYNNASSTAISAPAAGGTVPTWVSIDNPAGANINALAVFQAPATGTTDTSGTWAGATHMVAIVVRGQKTSSPVGGHSQSGSAAANLSIAPAITLSVLDGSSLAIAINFHKGLTAIGAAPSGCTQQLASTTGLCAVNTQNTTTGSPGTVTQADTSASGGYRGEQFEILAAPSSARPLGQVFRRARQALVARRKHRQAATARGQSVTTPTPLVRPRVVSRPDRRRRLIARRRHHNAIYVRPPIVAVQKFVRPAITVVERKRQALVARRRHKANQFTRAKLGNQRPRAPRVIQRPRTALAARRRHHGQQFISSRVAPYVRPKITVISRKQLPRRVARRKHHQAVVTRSRTFTPLIFVRQHILVVKRNLGARLARRKHQVRQVFRSRGGVPKDRWLTPDPSTPLTFDPAATGTIGSSAASSGSLTFSSATDGTLAGDPADDGDITLDPSENSEH